MGSHSICHIRYHTEYSGSAVKWGDGHMKVRFAVLALRYDPENVGNFNPFQKSSFKILQHAVLWTAATVCQQSSYLVCQSPLVPKRITWHPM